MILNFTYIDKIRICESIRNKYDGDVLHISDAISLYTKQPSTKSQRNSVLSFWKKYKNKKLKCKKCERVFIALYKYKKEMLCEECLNGFDRDGDKIDDKCNVACETLFPNPSRMIRNV